MPDDTETTPEELKAFRPFLEHIKIVQEGMQDDVVKEMLDAPPTVPHTHSLIWELRKISGDLKDKRP